MALVESTLQSKTRPHTCMLHALRLRILLDSTRYLGPDYGDGEKGPQEVVTAAQLPALAKQSFPLCMQVPAAHPPLSVKPSLARCMGQPGVN